MARKTVKDLDEDLQRVEAQLGALVTETETKVNDAVRREILEQLHTLTDTLDRRIDSRFRTAFIFAGVILTLFGAFGFFGVKSMVSTTVEDHIKESTVQELEQIKSTAKNELAQITKIRKAAEDSPLIVLQTDYGDGGYYMGRLKGVIYNINPKARVDVITSKVIDFDVINAAWILWRASTFYPSGTIFVVITNPGGLTSEPVIVETMNGHIYIGHDNGCFDQVVQNYGHKVTYRIASPMLTPKQFGDLFGGVDIFGPTAAYISLGFNLKDAGPQLDNYSQKLPNVQHSVATTQLVGTVMDVDHYGNVTTNLTKADLESAGIRVYRKVMVSINGGDAMTLPFKRTYGNVSKGKSVLILYEGFLQLAINEGDFSTAYNAKRGSKIVITP